MENNATNNSITLLCYDLKYNDIIISKCPVLRETPKTYCTEFYRFNKSDMGVVRKTTYSGTMFLEIAMLNASEEVLVKELSEWFKKMSNNIFDCTIIHN